MGETRETAPSGDPKGRLWFASFILDLDACILRRASGDIVPLTRSEFSLLRFLAQRPGRVFSRETLLNALSTRRFTPYDRSVDVVVARLRRKMEIDPKIPRFIVTVPGEGYRFDALEHPPAPSLTCDVGSDFPGGSLPSAKGFRARFASMQFSRLSKALTVSLLCLALSLAFLGLLRHWRESGPAPIALPRVAVPPFANLTGDAGNDYLGRKFAFEVSAFLASYPAVQVVASPDTASFNPTEIARYRGARFVVQGSLARLGDLLRVTAILYDKATQVAVWSKVFDSDLGVERPKGGDVPRQIYDTLSGFRGRIEAYEEQLAWGKASSELNESDFFHRGLSLYLRSTVSDVLKARAIFQEGLARYPESTLLRLRLAWTYLWMANNETDSDPRPEVERAWHLASLTLSEPQSPLEAWQAHWLMAFLSQWRDNDFSRSVAEAHDAAELAPYDAFSQSDLSWILANAGRADEAIEWARAALQHDPSGPSRYRANLAWACFVAGREREGIDALREKSSEFPILSAALHIRLGEIEEAKTLVAQYIQAGGSDTVHREDIVPLIEPAGTEYVETLRKAGMPER